jgi:hypothetical protein
LLITLVQKLFWGIDAPGYASLLVVLLFFNGLLMISNGIQGEYIARIFEEVKGRPLYVVGQTLGFSSDPQVVAAAPVVAHSPASAATPAGGVPAPSEPRRELPKPTKPPPLPRIQ